MYLVRVVDLEPSRLRGGLWVHISLSQNTDFSKNRLTLLTLFRECAMCNVQCAMCTLYNFIDWTVKNISDTVDTIDIGDIVEKI